MITTTKTRASKSRKNRKSQLPPSADVASIAGRDFIIMPLDEFEEWLEDRALAELVAERLASDEELIPLEEVEKRIRLFSPQSH